MDMEVNRPLVSVILTTYNREAEIVCRAAQSALKQSYGNIELIIVNDCPENTALAEEISDMTAGLSDDRVKYIVHERNMGGCQARNTGADCSNGALLAFLDDDDEWLPEKIEMQVKALFDEDAGAVSCDYYDYARGSADKPMIVSTGNNRFDLLEELMWHNCVGGSSEPLIRRSVFEQAGRFDPSMPALQDYDLWVRIARVSTISFVHKPLVKKYYSPDAITGSYSKKMKGFLLFQQINRDLYEKYPDALNFRYAQRVHYCFANRKLSDGMKYWKKAFQVKVCSLYNLTEPFKGIVKFFKYWIKGLMSHE